MNPPILKDALLWMLVPGIMQWPNDSRNWDGHAQTWFNRNRANVVVDRMDYFTGPITRRWHQQKRIDRVKSAMQQYYADQIGTVNALVHSNGDAIITEALAQMDWPEINELHLVSGAGPADFEKCGFNYALKEGMIKEIFVYVAGNDRALRTAAWTLGWLRPGRWIGYGTLGLKGAQNVDPAVKDRVSQIIEPTFGHSTWWAPANFDRMMRCVTHLGPKL